jgi:transcriptional regulator with XRE-family HTH domain
MTQQSQSRDIPGNVGQRVRALRADHGVTARRLAELAGFSPGYLSRLETGQVNPTISTLIRIMDALGEPVTRLFEASQAGPVVRNQERLVQRSRGVVDTLLTPSRNGRLEVLETVIEPNAGSGDEYNHWGDEECVVVMEGSLRIWIDGEHYDLAEGDAVTFACQSMHMWKNVSHAPARVMWIITPGGVTRRSRAAERPGA